MAFAVLFQVLTDKRQAEKVRPALLKAFRIILRFFGTDEDFQNEMRRYVMKPE